MLNVIIYTLYKNLNTVSKDQVCDIHLEHNIEQILTKVYRRFTNHFHKLQSNNLIITNRLRRDLKNRDSKFITLLANLSDMGLN